LGFNNQIQTQKEMGVGRELLVVADKYGTQYPIPDLHLLICNCANVRS